MEEKQLIEIEKDLFLAYGAKYGFGHSITRQFKTFLMNTRGTDARRMLAAAQNEMQAAAKTAALQTPGVGPKVAPAKSPLQPQPPTLPQPVELPVQLPTPTQPGSDESAGDVAENDENEIFLGDVMIDIHDNLPNIQIAARHSREKLSEYAYLVGASITPDMSEKQIVAAIKKALKK